jgi:hypothetical protein
VHVALDPPALLVGGGDDPATRGVHARGEGLALVGKRGQGERRQCRYGQIELGVEQFAVDRVELERAEVVGDRPYRESCADNDRQRRAARAEAHRRPGQRREREIAQRTAGLRRHDAQRDQGK